MSRINNALRLSLTVLSLMVLAAGCDRFTDWQTFKWDHYAAGFIIDNKVLADSREDGAVELFSPYALRLSWMIHPNDPGLLSFMETDPERQRQLEDLIHSFGEGTHQMNSYSGYTKPDYTMSLPDWFFFATPVDGITVSSDIDWEGQYPAGTALNDQFWFLSRCHDRFAKTVTEPSPQQAPKDFVVKSSYFMECVRSYYGAANHPQEENKYLAGVYEIILSTLDKVDFSSMDYLTPVYTLTSDNPHFNDPQTLKFVVRFRDGSTSETELAINPPVDM